MATQLAPFSVTQLTTQHKAGLARLLHTDMLLPEGNMTVLAAIDQTAISLIHYLETAGATALTLPRLIKLNQHHHK